MIRGVCVPVSLSVEQRERERGHGSPHTDTPLGARASAGHRKTWDLERERVRRGDEQGECRPVVRDARSSTLWTIHYRNRERALSLRTAREGAPAL